MKLLCSSFLAFVVLLLSGCGSKEIRYAFKEGKDVFEFETTSPDTVIRESITFSTMEVNTGKKEPIWIHFIYSEATPNVKKLTSIKASLSEIKDGQYKDLPSTCDLDIEYATEKDLVKTSRKNNTSPLNTLVDWNAVNYKYEFLQKEYVRNDNSVTYTCSYHFRPESYPDTLRLAVELTWENGSRKYETYLTKEEYKSRKFNPKF